MTDQCSQMREEFLNLGWTPGEFERARRVGEHLQQCAACQAAAVDYQALHAAMSLTEAVEPTGGWNAFEMRLSHAAKRSPYRMRWGFAIAAGLLLAITAINGWMLARNHPGRTSQPDPIAKTAPAVPVPNDLPNASVVNAFKTVSAVFDGRTNWIMLSDQSSEMGLADDHRSGTDLLVLRLVVKRGPDAISQMHFAIIPGATVRVKMPAGAAPAMQYVITTDALDLQKVDVWMSVEDGRQSPATELGSMATTLQIPFGKDTPTGQITTQDGTFDLSMLLEKGSRAGA